MLYQLPNGRTLVMAIERYLSLSDADIKDCIASQFGEEYNDPFHHSVLFDLKTGFASKELTLNHEDQILLDDLPEADRHELASQSGLQAIYDDGDYFSLEE